MGDRGMTLIEVVLFILVVGIAVVPLVGVFGNVLHSSAGHQMARTAAFLGQGVLEEVTGREFEDIADFTIPEGELSALHPGFRAEAVVFYTGPDDFNAPAGGAADFKRVALSIIWSGGRAEFTTVAAR